MRPGGGYFIARAVWDHHAFSSEPYTEREAWFWLIGAAAWEAKTIRVGKATVSLERGELAFSLRFLATKFKWSVGKIQRFIRMLETESMVHTQTRRESTQITICNYNEYQFTRFTGETQTDSPTGVQTIHQRDKEKKTNKQTNQQGTIERKDSAPPAAVPGGRVIVAEVFPPEVARLPRMTEPPARRSRPPVPADDWPEDYGELFWGAYPPGRKSGKKAVLGKLAIIRKNKEVTFARLMDGLARYVNSRPDPQYTKGPLVWLNQGCWDDEPTARGGRPLSYADIARGDF